MKPLHLVVDCVDGRDVYRVVDQATAEDVVQVVDRGYAEALVLVSKLARSLEEQLKYRKSCGHNSRPVPDCPACWARRRAQKAVNAVRKAEQSWATSLSATSASASMMPPR